MGEVEDAASEAGEAEMAVDEVEGDASGMQSDSQILDIGDTKKNSKEIIGNSQI